MYLNDRFAFICGPSFHYEVLLFIFWAEHIIRNVSWRLGRDAFKLERSLGRKVTGEREVFG